jgi:hypothetical protein
LLGRDEHRSTYSESKQVDARPIFSFCFFFLSLLRRDKSTSTSSCESVESSTDDTLPFVSNVYASTNTTSSPEFIVDVEEGAEASSGSERGSEINSCLASEG